jgi:hypothetical protein
MAPAEDPAMNHQSNFQKSTIGLCRTPQRSIVFAPAILDDEGFQDALIDARIAGYRLEYVLALADVRDMYFAFANALSSN